MRPSGTAGFSGWSLLPQQSPLTLFIGASAYDGATHRLVLFGGYQDGVVGDDTLVWTGTRWREFPPNLNRDSPPIGPPDLEGAVMGYDPRTRQLLFFGGSNGGSAYVTTWRWTGSRWTTLRTSAYPPAAVSAVMAWDPSSGQLLEFGGWTAGGAMSHETWMWNGDWVQLHPATNPPSTIDAAMAYDSETRQLLLFGGQLRKRFGKLVASNETWAWNGTNWTRLKPKASPSARLWTVMADDPAAKTFVLFGGESSSSQALDDTWKWTGATWVKLPQTKHPPARGAGSLTYDPIDHGLILFGGGNAKGEGLSDTWLWR